MEKNTKKTLRNILIFLLICLIVMGAAFYFSRNYLVVFPVAGDSMEGTIHNGEYALVFRTGKVDYGDIIVFLWEEENKYLIKRVIGLPGDKIEISYSNEDEVYYVYRNGEKLEEDYILEPMKYYSTISVEVPEGKIFFLGDNRMNSLDSHVGNFYADIKNVEGVVFMKYKGWKIKFL